MDKVSVIGSGFVGTMTAQRIVEKNLADVVLVDIIEGVPQGKALDIAHSSSLERIGVKIEGTNDYSRIEGSRIVIITAGFPRSPGMSRDDLAQKNGKIIQSVVGKIKRHAPGSIIIVVTNPLDLMAGLAWKISGFPPARVIGMGGVVDTARYKYLLAQELQASPSDVEALVIGTHGDTMIPLQNNVSVAGIPVSHFLSREKLQSIVERTKNSGAEVLNLLKTGSAFHTPSSAITAMVEAILHDSMRMLPAAVLLEGQYGIDGIYLGVPIKLGGRGVEEIYEIYLDKDELQQLRGSADLLKESFRGLLRKMDLG